MAAEVGGARPSSGLSSLSVEAADGTVLDVCQPAGKRNLREPPAPAEATWLSGAVFGAALWELGATRKPIAAPITMAAAASAAIGPRRPVAGASVRAAATGVAIGSGVGTGSGSSAIGLRLGHRLGLDGDGLRLGRPGHGLGSGSGVGLGVRFELGGGANRFRLRFGRGLRLDGGLARAVAEVGAPGRWPLVRR